MFTSGVTGNFEKDSLSSASIINSILGKSTGGATFKPFRNAMSTCPVDASGPRRKK